MSYVQIEDLKTEIKNLRKDIEKISIKLDTFQNINKLNYDYNNKALIIGKKVSRSNVNGGLIYTVVDILNKVYLYNYEMYKFNEKLISISIEEFNRVCELVE